MSLHLTWGVMTLEKVRSLLGRLSPAGKHCHRGLWKRGTTGKEEGREKGGKKGPKVK